jgi:hypothetical protein
MSFNRYLYTNANPVDYSDPSGLQRAKKDPCQFGSFWAQLLYDGIVGLGGAAGGIGGGFVGGWTGFGLGAAGGTLIGLPGGPDGAAAGGVVGGTVGAAIGTLGGAGAGGAAGGYGAAATYWGLRGLEKCFNEERQGSAASQGFWTGLSTVIPGLPVARWVATTIGWL